MGQYYKALYKEKNTTEWKGFDCYNITIGCKLMEHSYIGNLFVSTVKNVLFNNPCQVIWAGDYADDEPETEQNMYNLVETESLIKEDVSYEEMKSIQKVLKEQIQEQMDKMLYLVNETKGLYVDYSKVKETNWHSRIDPLPLLTAEGNSRGGGDYEGRNMKLVGSWARDVIYVTDKLPKGLVELIPAFKEGDFDDEEENS